MAQRSRTSEYLHAKAEELFGSGPKLRNLRRVYVALRECPSTRIGLEEKLSLSVTATWRLVEQLRGVKGRHHAYIKEWVHAGGAGKLTPVFAIGNRPDAVRADHADLKRARDKRRRDRQRETNEYEEALARERGRYWLRRLEAQKPIDPLTQALYGTQHQQESQHCE